MLAGGRSERFGAVNKLTALYRGAPLLQHAVLRLAEVCGDVLVVLAPGQDDPPMPPGAPVRFLRDATEGEGPLAGVYAALMASADADLLVVAGGDMPDLQTSVLFELLRVAGEAAADAVALQDDESFTPLPFVLRTAAGAEAAHMLLHAGRRSVRELLQSLRLAVIDEDTWVGLDPERRTLFDVDEPDDLAR